MYSSATGSWLRPAATIIAALSFVLVIVNAVLVFHNQTVQVRVSQRQQAINQAPALGRIQQALAQMLANVATAKQDGAIEQLLARHGIRIAPPQPQQQQSQQPAAQQPSANSTTPGLRK